MNPPEQARCSYCSKSFNPEDIVTINDLTKRLFCASEQSPLEPESCALRYLQENPRKVNSGNYFFVRVSDISSE